jgi:Fe-S cluster assembly protein SufD
VDHTAIVEGEGALHVESLVARLGESAELRAFGYVSNGDLVRRQIFASLVGENAKIALNGLSLLDGKRHADTTLVVDHIAPHGESREFFKHIVADEATGVYQGKVIVQPGAQKTDGGMKSQAILLSPNAVMNNKPELEIFADDVVCGHGATVGALDRDQLFYLRARGIPETEAEAMLLEAFVT